MSTLEPVRPIDRATYADHDLGVADTIQPHGIVAVVSATTFAIECVSENTQALLGRSAQELCGASLGTLFDAAESERLAVKLHDAPPGPRNPHRLTLAGSGGTHVQVECTVHRRNGRAIVEFEPCLPRVHDEAHLRRTWSPDGDRSTLLAQAARHLRALTGFERATIFRFESGGDVAVAEVGGETAGDDVAGSRGDIQLGQALRRLHARGGVRVVPDTQYEPARLVGAESRPTPSVDLQGTALCAVGADYLDALAATHARAAFSLPIVVRGKLWGVVACTHREPRRLSYRVRTGCERAVRVLARRLATEFATAPLDADVRGSSLPVRIAAAIEGSDDLSAALRHAAPELIERLGARGLAWCLDGEVARSGDAPRDDAVLASLFAEFQRAGETVRRLPGDALGIALSGEGDVLLAFGTAPEGRATALGPATLATADALRARVQAERQRQRLARAASATHLDLFVDERSRRAAALAKLADDITAALPARSGIAGAVFEFLGRHTPATGYLLERCAERELVVQAAAGSAAALSGTRTPRARTLAAMCAQLRAPIRCDDCAQDAEPTERERFARLGVGSLMAAPVTITEDETVVLTAIAAERFAFDDDALQALADAAAQLRSGLRTAVKFSALANAEIEQRTYAQRLRALHDIAATATTNRRDQIDAALVLGLEQLGMDWAFLGIIDYEKREFVFENSVAGAAGSQVCAPGTRTPLEASIMGRVATQRGVRIVQDVADLAERPLFGGWATFIAAPLFIDGVNHGAIGFTASSVRQQPFSEADVEFIAVAGELIASALERGLQRDLVEQSEMRYRALTEAIPEMVCVLGDGDSFEYVNARWTNYTGLSLEQSRRVGPSAVCDAATWPIVVSGRNAVPPVEFEAEVRFKRADGAYRWHALRVVPLDGAPNNWLLTATDIEARKSADALMTGIHDAALAATEAKSRFLATMSHEIRTPMNAVIGMTELLLLTQLNDEQREYIEIVRDSGQSLLRVLNDVLDYSKIEAGKLELESVQFDLAGQIESVVELLRAQYQIKGVRLTTVLGADVPSLVWGDPGRLRQILLNLVGNALKFTAPGGSVHVEVTAVSTEGDIALLRFTVEDTGIGIAPETVGRLFQPFSQGDESTTRKYGGTGLGLSICSQLVALMSGTIGVDSVPGEGSSFWFEIPLRGEAHSAKSSDGRKRAASRSKPVVMRAEKILLVEDNEINTFLALKQLQRIGFVVSAVSNGREAVEAVERQHFDLVLMDCHMPEMDGFAATREIRQREAQSGSRHVPIVAMTADARTEDHQNCLSVGMDDYVSKPTSLESLRAVLDRWLPAPDRRQTTRNVTTRANPATTLRVAKLLELFGGDRSAVITLLTAAAGAIKADFGRIEKCLAIGDFAAVAEAAHRLKSTSASIRSPFRLGDLSDAVEAAALGQPAAVPETLIGELRAAIDALILDVEKHSSALATTG